MTTPTEKDSDWARSKVRALLVKAYLSAASLFERLAEAEAMKA